jgi:excisionase family DNA binding protein
MESRMETLSTPPGQWLTLQEASARLDVHPTTLRHWADRGQVRVYRTPGGHRRFNEEDVRALLTDNSARGLDLLVDAAVGHTRLETSDGRLDAEPWYGRLDEVARQRHRELGRDLLQLLRAHLDETASPPDLSNAQGLGRRYAAMAHEAGLTIAEAMRAFLFFQEMVAGSVRQLSGLSGQPADLDRRVELFVNEVLITMVESYTEAKS